MLRNRRLNELVRDLDLEVGVEVLERRPWDREAVHTLFDGLEFRVLRDRLFQTFPAEEDEVAGGELDVDPVTLTGDAVGAWLAAAGSEPAALDVVGTWALGTGDASTICLLYTSPSPRD